jgi:hypothetical protein
MLHRHTAPVPMTAATPAAAPDFLVACLCAAWCGTCRDYQAPFEAMAADFPAASFHWVDIEDEDAGVDDLDVENFPTIVVQRGELVLFCGPMLPQPGILRRTLETLLAMSAEEAAAYANRTPERAAWQDEWDLRARLRRTA